jgi:deoxycytidine triphosphate deaminase
MTRLFILEKGEPMLLNKDQIRARGLIQDGEPPNFREASYDLRVGEILPAPRERKGTLGLYHVNVPVPASGFFLEPQGMVTVISKEIVKLPPCIAGYALVKNSMSNAGILAINIGVIDPGYDGPIASTLINFGKQPFLLKPGMVYLRLTFHVFEPSGSPEPPHPIDRPTYLERTRQQVSTYSSPTFLNLDKTAELAGENAFGEFKKWLIVWAGVIALLLGFLAGLVPMAASYADRAIAGREALEKELSKDENKIDQLEQALENLKDGRSGTGGSRTVAPLRQPTTK